MLELQIRDGVDVANGLKSYETISGEEWDVVAGADHGQGAWRSYIKFFTEDTKWRREQADKAKNQRSSGQIRNGGYCIKQSAHMECRKDTAELLNATVTKDLDEGYSSLLCSRLIAMSTGEKVQAVIISKHAIGMRVGKGENGKNVLRHLQTHFCHCDIVLRYCDMAMPFFPRIFEIFPELCHSCQKYVNNPRIQAILMYENQLIKANFN